MCETVTVGGSGWGGQGQAAAARGWLSARWRERCAGPRVPGPWWALTGSLATSPVRLDCIMHAAHSDINMTPLRVLRRGVTQPCLHVQKDHPACCPVEKAGMERRWAALPLRLLGRNYVSFRGCFKLQSCWLDTKELSKYS